MRKNSDGHSARLVHVQIITMPGNASPPLWLTLTCGGGDSTRGGLAHPRGLRREASRCLEASLGVDKKGQLTQTPVTPTMQPTSRNQLRPSKNKNSDNTIGTSKTNSDPNISDTACLPN